MPSLPLVITNTCQMVMKENKYLSSTPTDTTMEKMSFPATCRRKWENNIESCRDQVEAPDNDRAQDATQLPRLETLVESLYQSSTSAAERLASLDIRTAVQYLEELGQAFDRLLGGQPCDALTWGWIVVIIEASSTLTDSGPHRTRSPLSRQVQQRLYLQTSIFTLFAEMLKSVTDGIPQLLELEHRPLLHDEVTGTVLEVRMTIDRFLSSFISGLHELENRMTTDASYPQDSILFHSAHDSALKQINHASNKIDRLFETADVTKRFSAPWEQGQKSVARNAKVRCAMLPSGRSARFYGRTRELEHIDKYLRTDVKDEVRSLALHGLGGVGKTQTALAYCYSRLDDFDVILWLAAETKIALEFSLKQAAQRLNLIRSDEEGPHVVETMMTWLEVTPCKWLVVYDNAEAEPFLKKMVPKAVRGAILMTTRNVNLSRVPCSAGYEIGSFTIADGAGFLRQQLASHDIAGTVATEEELQAAYELSSLVGGHALALTQMAGLICSRDWGLTECLDMYKARPKTLHGLTKEIEIDDNYKLFISTVFLEGLKRVQKSDSFTLLGVLSFLVPDGIPQQLFELKPDPDLPQGLGFCRDPMSFDEAFRSLRTLALVTKESKGRDKRTLALHRLVQREASFFVDQPERQRHFEFASLLLYRAFPVRVAARFLHSRWSECEMYIQHVLSLMDHWKDEAELPKLSAPVELCYVMSSAAWYLHELGSYDILRDFLSTAYRVFDDTTLMDRAKMHFARLHMVEGVMWDNLGHFQKSMDHFKQCLDICLDSLDPSDEFIGGTYNDLGNVCESLGQWQEALDWHEKAWEIRRKRTEPTGENIAHSQSNTARALLMLGEDEEAYKRMDSAERTFRQASAWFHEAHCHFCKGNYHRKRKEYDLANKQYGISKDLLLNQVKAKSHVRTSSCYFKLGAVAIDQDDPKTALGHLNTALEICEKQTQNLGDRARTLNMRAVALSRMGEDHRREAEAARNEAQTLYGNLVLHIQGKSPKEDPTELDYDLLVCGLHR